MTFDANIWAIVPAAGTGARMQADLPKQYLPLLGRPVIVHTLTHLCSYPRLRGILVGLAPGDAYWGTITAPISEKFLGTYTGGARRAQTVLYGLEALSGRAGADDWVMVHDAVRPCVRHADLDKLVVAALASPDGAILAVPVADTVKRADREARIQETIPRAGLWRALTPQMFPFGKLRAALTAVLNNSEDVTDEAAAMERMGARPRLVEGHADNIKITHPTDLVLAEMFLKQQSGEQP